MSFYNDNDSETLRERNIQIKLSDFETRILLSEATRRNTTVEQILEDFIANFTASYRSRGGDERRLADEYVDRCIYYFDDNESFTQWLESNGYMSEALDSDDQELEELYEEYVAGGGSGTYDEAMKQLEEYEERKARLEK